MSGLIDTVTGLAQLMGLQFQTQIGTSALNIVISTGGGIPMKALLWNSQPLLWNGQYLVW